MLTDPIGDCFGRLRNAAKAGQEEVKIPHSQMKEGIVRLLQNEGYLIGFEVEEASKSKKTIIARIKYNRDGRAVLESIKRVSRPGHRVYAGVPSQPKVRRGIGLQILSTNQGIVSDKQAIEKKVGGEVLGEVY
jgi:small subunit ribosomal protein S8